ncbi:GATA transcription factor 8-like [Populus alba x Populus x berolinensis]|uniref:GATA transcription factor n=1 Tax=Populus davidiana TaxID=266767 RepID=A0A6M2FD14_9ROSI|nr:GATA transcription factor 8-like [Populus alba x Populus x berolinensis]
MIGQTNTSGSFMDEIDCGSFFDHIDDLLDFPSDDVDASLPDCTTTNNHASCFIDNDDNSFPGIWSTQSDSLPGSASDLSAELSVPYEDIVQLEWLSNFVEDSFSGGSLTMKKEESVSVDKKDSTPHHQFQTSSPVSVLESSGYCSGEKNAPRSPEVVASGKCGRARSKRPRPAAFTPRPAMQLVSPTSSITEVPQQFVSPRVPSDSESFAESRLVIKIPDHVEPEHKKKKKIKFIVPSGTVEINQNSQPQQAVRKCMHCEITKTPQWRAGPMGPKTLCNACGVRYKSGRLFPEYRPAASPTFVPSLHSNSHKKVVEMRAKTGEKITTSRPATMMVNSPELIPNESNPAMDYM